MLVVSVASADFIYTMYNTFICYANLSKECCNSPQEWFWNVLVILITKYRKKYNSLFDSKVKLLEYTKTELIYGTY